MSVKILGKSFTKHMFGGSTAVNKGEGFFLDMLTILTGLTTG
jgi:hypothetical protein